MLPDFPHFAPLHLEDKDSYNELVAEFPPHSDISFTTLHIWWNLEKQLSISSLKGNMVINYHLAHDQENSGYSLIGKHSIDDSITTVFEHLQKQHSPVRLVHVPEFVVDKIKHKELFNLKEELDYNEYILDSHTAAALEGGKYANTRKKINRFLKQVEGKQIEVMALDLSSADSRDQVLHSIQKWEEEKPWKNDPDRTEYQAIEKTLEHASVLDVQNLCVYIDGKLYAILLYHKSIDNKYYTMHHLKVDHSFIYIVDYVEQTIARKAVEENVPFINLEMDLGIQGLREHKIGLKPIEFFRKYTITPAG